MELVGTVVHSGLALPQAAGWPGTALSSSGLSVTTHTRDKSSGVAGGCSAAMPVPAPSPTRAPLASTRRLPTVFPPWPGEGPERSCKHHSQHQHRQTQCPGEALHSQSQDTGAIRTPHGPDATSHSVLSSPRGSSWEAPSGPPWT
ncbi:unnamed protein product [Rangifer tarandus platyrhynchus]|uniref:Uncharacterized protein n=1 Tax=Rangifer tarandus platyrhynchus TaxID=3082113 RepID=A0AC60A6T4_RANTA